MDGNNDSIFGGSYTNLSHSYAAYPVLTDIFRNYGDVLGVGRVEANPVNTAGGQPSPGTIGNYDYSQFRSAFGPSDNKFFNTDGDNDVDFNDYVSYRNNFNTAP